MEPNGEGIDEVPVVQPSENTDGAVAATMTEIPHESDSDPLEGMDQVRDPLENSSPAASTAAALVKSPPSPSPANSPTSGTTKKPFIRQGSAGDPYLLHWREGGGKGGAYHCSECGKQYPKRSRFILHLRSHAGEQPFKCTHLDCDKRFSQLHHMQRHLATHTREMELQRGDSMASSGSQPHFIRQGSCEDPYLEYWVADAKSYVCDFSENNGTCGAKFLKRAKLIRHLRTHTKEQPYQCDFPGCDKRFSRSHHLKRHILSHQGVKPFQCDSPGCGKGFSTRSHLQRHTRLLHGTTAAYQCNFPDCGMSFPKANQLRRHECTHTNTKPYKCPEPGCDKSFEFPGKLKKHVALHRGEKLYVCGHADCGMSFPMFSALQTHTKTVHKNGPRIDSTICWVCDVCGLSMKSKSSLVQHMKTHDLDRPEILCIFPDCGKAFQTSYNMYAHFRTTHTGAQKHKCPHCSAEFVHASSRDRHVKNIHDKSKTAEKEVEPPSSAALDTLTNSPPFSLKAAITGVVDNEGESHVSASPAHAVSPNDITTSPVVPMPIQLNAGCLSTASGSPVFPLPNISSPVCPLPNMSHQIS